MRNILVVVLVLSFVSGAYGSFSGKDIGTSAAQFLKLGAGARATGMGDAFVAISNDATSVYWNPAGLNRIEKKSVSVMHALWLEEIFYDWASYVHPTNFGNFGIGIQYVSYGEIKEMDEDGFETGESFKPSDLAATISYGRNICNVLLGLNIKYISSKIKESASAVAVDIGMMREFAIKDKKISTGLVVQNLGTEMKFVDEKDPLPLSIKVGGAYDIRENWVVALDVNLPADNKIGFGVGSEYSHKLSEKFNVAGRAGYNTRTDTGGLSGLTLGLGFGYTDYSLEYAFVPFGDMGSTHRISVGIKF